MTSPKSYDGSCFCGAVQFTVTGAPGRAIVIAIRAAIGRRLPLMPSHLWRPENVRITRGEENIGTFSKTPQSYRKHPGLGLTDVYAAVIPDVPFIPGLQ